MNCGSSRKGAKVIDRMSGDGGSTGRTYELDAAEELGVPSSARCSAFDAVELDEGKVGTAEFREAEPSRPIPIFVLSKRALFLEFSGGSAPR